MQKRIEALLLLAIVLAALAAPLLVNDYVLVSDFWERQRVSAEIVSQESFPHFNSIYEPSAKYIYPLGIDALDSFLSIASDLSFLNIAQAMGFIIMALLSMLVYLFVSRIYSHNVGIISALFVAFMPRIARLGMQPIPEMAGLVLIAATLFLLSRKNYKTAGLALGAALFFHYRSFFTALLIAALYLWFFRKQIDAKKAPGIALAPILMIPVYLASNLPALLSGHSISNPFVFDWNALQVFGPILIVGIVGLLWALKNKKHLFLCAWLIAFGLLYAVAGLQSNILQFRELIYAFIPVAVLAALFLESRPRYLKFAVPIAGLCLITMLGMNLVAYPPVDKMDSAAIKTLKDSKDSVIMAGFVPSYGIPAIAGKNVVVGAFMEGLPDGNQRIKDLNELLYTKSGRRAAEIMRKYGTKTLFLGRFETLPA
ncbi:MAG: hypothetical protein WC602_04460, partial [archaeon]